MERAVLISIRPEWVEKILNGEKTIEIRKSMPKCELPCKVYVYCTKGTRPCMYGWRNAFYSQSPNLNGKIVAGFTLNKVDFIKMPTNLPQEFLEKSCLNGSEIMAYLGGDFYKDFYAWHIEDLVVYDKPKELHEFGVYDVRWSKARKCEMPGWFPLKRPPQSWCYVEK